MKTLEKPVAIPGISLLRYIYSLFHDKIGMTVSMAADTVGLGPMEGEGERVLQTGDRGTLTRSSGDETAGGHQSLLSCSVQGYRAWRQVRGRKGKGKGTQNCTAMETIERSRDVAKLVERRTGTPLKQVRFPGAAKDFSPRVNFQCRLPFSVRTPPCTPPKGGRGCLMSPPPCLESQGCHLIPLYYLLSCSSA